MFFYFLIFCTGDFETDLDLDRDLDDDSLENLDFLVGEILSLASRTGVALLIGDLELDLLAGDFELLPLSGHFGIGLADLDLLRVGGEILFNGALLFTLSNSASNLHLSSSTDSMILAKVSSSSISF